MPLTCARTRDGPPSGPCAGDRRRRDHRRETLSRLGLDALTVSERDILHGIALEAAQLPEPVEGDALPALTPAARPAPARRGGSSSASRRWSPLAGGLPPGSPSTGTRSASFSSMNRKASSAGASASTVHAAPRRSPHRRLAGVPAGGDHLADERLPRDDADEAVPVADEDRRTSGRASAWPASCALSPTSSVGGSATIASRTIVRIDPARRQRPRNLADGGDQRGLPQSDTELVGQIPDPVKRVTDLLGELVPDLVPPPEQPPEILHPLEVGDRHAAGVREDVRQDDDAALGRVGLDRRRAVRALRDHLRVDPAGVVGRDLILEGGEDEDVAGGSSRSEFETCCASGYASSEPCSSIQPSTAARSSPASE